MKSGSSSGDTENFDAKAGSMGTGGTEPVRMLYAPESRPIEGLLVGLMFKGTQKHKIGDDITCLNPR